MTEDRETTEDVERKAKDQQKDAGPDQDTLELREKVRTEERPEPEPEMDNERSGEEPIVLPSRHIPGETWIHKGDTPPWPDRAAATVTWSAVLDTEFRYVSNDLVGRILEQMNTNAI
ncbi:hypothetical protein NDU88_003254 [Pleurodeles waltl]|uniref:Uncharacterized protein n=1 Tax=Pleurodeles waltl TaxID=8319 RepID=A0AAV7V184_PLEWA|nr:hypothetical protein NDU88_003254 [Pleurodeles waltl]